MFEAGMARTMITPPIGTPLAGYPTRTEGSDRVLDDVYVRALVVRSGATAVCLVSCDAMAVDTRLVSELREELHARHGIREENVLVAATHTHSSTAGLLSFSGPAGNRLGALFCGGAGAYDVDQANYLRSQIAQCVDEAFSRLAPATVGIAIAQAPGVASNRVDPGKEVSHQGTVIAFRSPEGRWLGALLHFVCHPTTLGAGDRGISADFPGLVCSELERELGDGAVVGYLNGALGDISTRYTRDGFGHDEARRFATILATAFSGAIASINVWTSDLELSAAEADTVLPARSAGEPDPGAVSRLQEELSAAERRGAPAPERRAIEIALQGAQLSATWQQLGQSETGAVECKIQRLSLSPLVDLVALPGEPFSWIGDQITQGHSPERVLVVAPANGYLGYFPDQASYEISPYEANASVVRPQAAQVLVDTATELLAGRRLDLAQGGESR
jgi:neutral ceramidase